jgi:hypothetical protein
MKTSATIALWKRKKKGGHACLLGVKAGHWTMRKRRLLCFWRHQEASCGMDFPKGCPKSTGFAFTKVQYPTMKGLEWIDAYNALFAAIACDPCLKLAKVYHSWKEVESALADPKKSIKSICIINVI